VRHRPSAQLLRTGAIWAHNLHLCTPLQRSWPLLRRAHILAQLLHSLPTAARDWAIGLGGQN
jgi:hypothetical protein